MRFAEVPARRLPAHSDVDDVSPTVRIRHLPTHAISGPLTLIFSSHHNPTQPHTHTMYRAAAAARSSLPRASAVSLLYNAPTQGSS